MELEQLEQYIETEHSGYQFEDVLGREFWTKLLGSYVSYPEYDEALGLQPSENNILLYGPFGSGKSFLLDAQAGEMISAGYQYVKLDLGKVSTEKHEEIFEAIYEQFIAKQPTYLAIENLEALENDVPIDTILNCVAANEDHLIMSAHIEDETQIHPKVRKWFSEYYVGLPEEEDRKAYFEENISSLFAHESVGAERDLLNETKGYNYLQLASTVQQIKFQMKFTLLEGKKSMENVTNMLDPEILKDVFGSRKLEKEERQHSWLGSQEVKKLEELMGKITIAGPAPKEEKEEEPVKEKPRMTMDDRYNPEKNPTWEGLPQLTPYKYRR